MHVITGLEGDRAETMLLKRVSALERKHFISEVVSLTTAGPMATRFTEAGMRVRALGMVRGRPDTVAVTRLSEWMKSFRPDVVQTWLYHADLLGGIAAQMAGIRRVISSVSQSNLSWKGNKWSTLLAAAFCAVLSWRLPNRIVCCLETARQAHVKCGYCAPRMLVIPNGFDLERGASPHPLDRFSPKIS